MRRLGFGIWLAAVALAVLWLTAVAVSFVRARAAEAAYPPLGTFVFVDGRRVHGLVVGEGPDLVLIHGSSGHIRDFTFSFVDQVKDHYRVIVLDRPGLGHSDPLPKGAEGIHEQARFLREAAIKFGADRPIVLGQSYGAAVALAWALDAPEGLSALVTVSGPSHPWTTELSRYYKVTSHPLGQIFAVPMISAIYNEAQVSSALAGVFDPQEVPANYAEGFGVALTMTPDRMRANARQRASLRAEVTALADHYSALAVPLEIVHGDADTTVAYDIHASAMIRDTDRARLTLVPGVGHMPHHVAPQAVIAAIDRAARRAAEHSDVE